MSLSLITYADLPKVYEQAKGEVTWERQRIAGLLAEADPEGLYAVEVGRMLPALAEAEGRYAALHDATTVWQNDGDPLLAVMRRVENGPGDTWSGRNNDVRRAFFDGVLDVLRDLRTATPRTKAEAVTS